MEHAAPAAIDPVNLDSQGLERFVVGPDMSTAARSAHTDRRRMLAQDQDGPALFAQLVDDAPLKLLDLREVDQPQHINFERRQLRGWPHRRSTGRQIRGRYQLHRFEQRSSTHSLYTRKTPLGKCGPTHPGCRQRQAIFGDRRAARPEEPSACRTGVGTEGLHDSEGPQTIRPTGLSSAFTRAITTILVRRAR